MPSRLCQLLLTLCLLFPVAPVHAAKPALQLQIEEAYLELHTGAGRSYPVFFVAQRGEQIEIIKRRNDWFKVRLQASSHREKTGWVHRDAIANTLVAGPGESKIRAKDEPALACLFEPRFYFGSYYGQLDGTDTLGLQLGYQGTDQIAVELQAGEFVGANTEGSYWSLSALMTPFDGWRLQPFVMLGAGEFTTNARRNNSTQNDGTDKLLLVSTGMQWLMSKRYRLRFEYRHLNILTSRSENEEYESWQLGFTGYF